MSKSWLGSNHPSALRELFPTVVPTVVFPSCVEVPSTPAALHQVHYRTYCFKCCEGRDQELHDSPASGSAGTPVFEAGPEQLDSFLSFSIPFSLGDSPDASGLSFPHYLTTQIKGSPMYRDGLR